MDDLKDPAAAQPDVSATTTPIPTLPPRRRGLRKAVLYFLSGIGVLALALVGLMFYAQIRGEKAPARATIDEAASIESVMGDTYGKYSEAKKGWLYVADDDVTYLMRVVQQAKITEGADGDELYFMASGAAVDGSESAMYGAFHVHPNDKHDGGLTYENTQVRHYSKQAVRPESVHFEALSESLWGWVVKTQHGGDPASATVQTMNTILAPHDGQIAELGEFLAASDGTPAGSCDDAKAAWDAFMKPAAPAPATENKADGETAEEPLGGIDEESTEPVRCDKRRWTYRTGTVSGNIPVPFTVTLGGTQDGKPVEARTWKLMFDPKSFSYNIPEELMPDRGEE
jgi:hypothetical protein